MNNKYGNRRCSTAGFCVLSVLRNCAHSWGEVPALRRASVSEHFWDLLRAYKHNDMESEVLRSINAKDMKDGRKHTLKKEAKYGRMVDFGKKYFKNSINKIKHDTGKSFVPDFNCLWYSKKKKHCYRLQFLSRGWGRSNDSRKVCVWAVPRPHLGLLSSALGSRGHTEHWVRVGLLSPLGIPGEPRWRLYCMCVNRGSPACCAGLWHLRFLIWLWLGSRLVLFEEGSLFFCCCFWEPKLHFSFLKK